MDPASIIASIKAAYDIAKGIGALHTVTERNEAVSKVLEILISVQQDTLSMQQERFLLQQEKETLLKKISEFEQWDQTAAQYELKEIAPGVFVYSLKKDTESTDPAHYLCVNCYTNRQKGFLIQLEPVFSGTHYKCSKCDKEIIDYSKKRPPPPLRRDISYGF